MLDMLNSPFLLPSPMDMDQHLSEADRQGQQNIFSKTLESWPIGVVGDTRLGSNSNSRFGNLFLPRKSHRHNWTSLLVQNEDHLHSHNKSPLNRKDQHFQA